MVVAASSIAHVSSGSSWRYSPVGTIAGASSTWKTVWGRQSGEPSPSRRRTLKSCAGMRDAAFVMACAEGSIIPKGSVILSMP